MSLVAWFPFNGDTKNRGLSSFALSGTPSYSADKGGRFLNKALALNKQLNGTISELTGLTTWSVAFWYMVNADDTLSSDWVDVIGLRDQKADNSATGDYRFETCYGSSKAVGLGQYNNGTQATQTVNGGTIVSEKGVWHHVCSSINAETGQCLTYVDGVLKQTRVHAGGHLTGYIWIGQNNVINGYIQDVRFYNHALSKKEVKELAKGLFIHLPLDWGAGNPNLTTNSATVGNSSGNNGNYTHETIYYDGYPVRRMTVKGSSYGPWGGGFTTSNGAVAGNVYTWSMMVRGSDNFTFTNWGHERGGGTTVKVTKEWTYVSHTWTYSSSGNQAFIFYGCSNYNNTTGAWIEVKQLKIEEGSVATPYIPHVDEALYSKFAYSTKYLNDCSGYNNEVKAIGSNNTSCTSPKGLGGTTCGANSCINLGTAPKIQYPLTIAFWFNTSDLSVNNNRLISCTEGGGWNIEASSTNLRWTIGTGTSSNTYKYCDSTKTLTQLQDAWHHIVCTYNGLKAQMYIDGTLEKEVTHYTTATPIYYNNNNAVFLCGESGANTTTPATTYTVNTSVADFRVYATALSADDVKALYQNSVEIDKTGKIYCGNLVEV